MTLDSDDGVPQASVHWWVRHGIMIQFNLSFSSYVTIFYFINTNASYNTDSIQNILKEIKGNVLFIADEVHNFGAEGLRSVLND